MRFIVFVGIVIMRKRAPVSNINNSGGAIGFYKKQEQYAIPEKNIEVQKKNIELGLRFFTFEHENFFSHPRRIRLSVRRITLAAAT